MRDLGVCVCEENQAQKDEEREPCSPRHTGLNNSMRDDDVNMGPEPSSEGRVSFAHHFAGPLRFLR